MQTSDATSRSPKVRPLIWHLTVQGSKPPLYFLLLSALCSQQKVSQLSFCCHCCFHSCCHSTLCKAQTFILKPWTAPRMLCKESFQRKRLSGGGKAKHSGRISRVHNAESRTRVPFKIASTLSTMLDSSLNTVSLSSPALLVSEWRSSVGQRRFCVDTKNTFEHFVTEVTLNFPRTAFLRQEQKVWNVCFWKSQISMKPLDHYPMPLTANQKGLIWLRKNGQFSMVFS